MKPCERPLDPIDVEALASDAEPVLDARSAEHVASCESCRDAVARARSLEALFPAPPAYPAAADVASRILRLRSFSRAERRSLSLWKAPLLLLVGVALSGLLLLGSPALALRDQGGLVATLAAAAAAILRALFRWGSVLAASGPSGLEGLAQALRREPPLGWIALAILLPAGLGLRRVLARARRPAR